MDEKQLKEAIAAMAKDKGQKDALAQLLIEWVQPNHITVDFVSMLLDSRSLKPGDALVKKLRKGIKVHTLVPGSIHMAHEVTVSERINYVLDGADVKVTANEWELEGGEIGTMEDMRREMLAKLKDFYMNKVFTALSTIWTAVNTPSNYTNVGGALNATVLKAAIDNINQTVGRTKAIVGVRATLTPITTFGGFWADPTAALHRVDSQLEEVMRTGWLGVYYGAPVIALDQIYDNPEDYNALLPTDKVLVIGENVGEFITFGAERWKEYTDPRPTPPQWFLEVYQQFGMLIWNAMGIHVLGNIS